MNNIFKNLNVEFFGESHSTFIGACLKGIPKGYKVNIKIIEQILIDRNPSTFYNTLRKDKVDFRIISGLRPNINGEKLSTNNEYITDGKDLIFHIYNNNIKSQDYTKYRFRLGHADYTSFKKFGKNYPYKGGGPFSGRMTALIIVIGEIAKQILEQNSYDYKIYTQVKKIENYQSKSILSISKEQLDQQEHLFKSKYNKSEDFDFLCFNPTDQKEVLKILQQAKDSKDTIGCELEIKITNIEQNFGNLYTDSFESIISSAMFAIPGIKGINFGVGEKYYQKRGSSLVEEVEVKDNRIIPLTNIAGGINGGITNGYQDIYFTCIVKPPMSLQKEMDLLILNNGKYEVLKDTVRGRHDIFIGNKISYAIKGWLYTILLDYTFDKK